MGQLVHRNLAEHLSIRVFKRPKKKDHLGLCVPYDQKKCRDFDIILYGSPKKRSYLKTLAHECVHVGQFATGERTDFKRYPNKVRFRDKEYQFDLVEYEDAPWELDALHKEVVLTAGSGEGGQGFRLKADSDSGRSRTAFR